MIVYLHTLILLLNTRPPSYSSPPTPFLFLAALP